MTDMPPAGGRAAFPALVSQRRGSETAFSR